MSNSAFRNRRRVILSGLFCVALLLVATVLDDGAFAQKKKSSGGSKSAAPTYKFAYEHGYRAGYEDGFAQGKADIGREQLRDFGQNDRYNRADRTYQDRMGLQIEYQEGYRSGFEIAYSDGYFGRDLLDSHPRESRSRGNGETQCVTFTKWNPSGYSGKYHCHG